MAALVQTLPPQTTTMTMMPGRPSSSGGYPSSPQQHPILRHTHTPRYASQPTGYRGLPASGPISPYAFKSTPQLVNNSSPRPNTVGHSDRPTVSAVIPQLPPLDFSSGATLIPRQQAPGSIPTSSSITSQQDATNGSSSSLGLPQSSSTMSTTSTTSAKPSPDRYRRNIRRVDSAERVASSVQASSGAATTRQLYSQPAQSTSSPALTSHQVSPRSEHTQRKSSADDMTITRSQNTELAARYRRRSLGGLETQPAGLVHADDVQDTASPHPNAFMQPSAPLPQPEIQAPAVTHSHHNSADSNSSSRSAKSSRPNSRHETTNPSTMVSMPQPASPSKPAAQPATASKPESRYMGVPSRAHEQIRRNPSPLSRPINMEQEAEDRGVKEQNTSSPAAERLAAISQKDGKKKGSKLRRAFSFGSTAELKRVTEQPTSEMAAPAPEPTPRSAKTSSKYEDELEPEQAAIAEKQEAAGLGESIYSGQGRFFTGSTDNLSVSSTASSASVMLRKMGRGMKKGTRSLVGLFRPKSVVGVPPADGPVNFGSATQVSMVTVEAEREKVNVNANVHDQAGGGTGFPKLERNSIDTKMSMESAPRSSDTRSRRSIVGGEKERAEVLAAVKKGILKRNESGQSSPRSQALDSRSNDRNLPQMPHINDSPHSSSPSTPVDEPPRSGHRRTDSITIESNDHDDYFGSMSRFATAESGGITTPKGTPRNISFSPRIQFHDTWPSGEYDRRGEIATCNRLTPMLAQQIKEELNTFKMEMEVHESSKVYTHFF